MTALTTGNRLKNITQFASILTRTFASKPGPAKRPSIAPKQLINVKHIRENPELYSRTCVDRNYLQLQDHPQRIISLFDEWKRLQHGASGLRQRNNAVQALLKTPSKATNFTSRDELLTEAGTLKESIGNFVSKEAEVQDQIESLAAALPNLTDSRTPIGQEVKVLAYINERPNTPASDLSRPIRDHSSIGSELEVLDFAGAATTSGWGWYFLKNEAVLLEQALIQYAFSVAMKHGFSAVAPPSIVYSHIADACGFQPRDQGGEQQSYVLSQNDQTDNQNSAMEGKPELTLTGTGEIPFAGMKANTIMDEKKLPMKIMGASRCYRAEAGARGIETKGLYRVHEFTKVEMFAWATPEQEDTVFDTLLKVQKEILDGLGLHCRILEMPTVELGASATRKIDIEAYFPSRSANNDGWGEVTSLSNCTDYQSRRLNTRFKPKSKNRVQPCFPSTINGTALAVPRIVAALLENGWNEEEHCVEVPGCLHYWMHGITRIDDNGLGV
ncbi:MAG: hypothetical protein Q9220_003208 [cf. Caloplaca sp. 1 TL-2023]